MRFLAAAHNQASTEEVRHKKATAIEAVELVSYNSPIGRVRVICRLGP